MARGDQSIRTRIRREIALGFPRLCDIFDAENNPDARAYLEERGMMREYEISRTVRVSHRRKSEQPEKNQPVKCPKGNKECDVFTCPWKEPLEPGTIVPCIKHDMYITVPSSKPAILCNSSMFCSFRDTCDEKGCAYNVRELEKEED